jgi:hypothetical protein
MNPFTMAGSPLRPIEYLAMGMPVVSTRIPALLRYDSAIQWVEQGDGESYARALDAIKSEQRNPTAFTARSMTVFADTNKTRLEQFRMTLMDRLQDVQPNGVADRRAKKRTEKA